MKRKFIVLLFLFMLIVLSNNNYAYALSPTLITPDSSVVVRSFIGNKLYYSDSYNYLYVYDFETKESRMAYPEPFTYLMHVYNDIAIGILREPGTHISRINLVTGEVSYAAPTSMEGHNKAERFVGSKFYYQDWADDRIYLYDIKTQQTSMIRNSPGQDLISASGNSYIVREPIEGRYPETKAIIVGLNNIEEEVEINKIPLKMNENDQKIFWDNNKKDYYLEDSYLKIENRSSDPMELINIMDFKGSKILLSHEYSTGGEIVVYDTQTNYQKVIAELSGGIHNVQLFGDYVVLTLESGVYYLQLDKVMSDATYGLASDNKSDEKFSSINISRNDNILGFDILVDRYFGPVLNTKLTHSKNISSIPRLTINYKIASQGSNDKVRLADTASIHINNHQLNILNDNGVQLEAEIPIEYIKFPDLIGNLLIKATNNFSINFNNNYTSQLASIEMATITIQGTRPVVLVHGYTSDGSTWDKWFNSLQSDGIPYHTFSMAPEEGGNAIGTSKRNAMQLKDEIQKTKQKFGVNLINIISHSKGGLDSRTYLNNLTAGKNDVKNLIMIATPNGGSELADMALTIAAQQDPLYVALLDTFNPGLRQLTLQGMNEFNNEVKFNKDTSYWTIAGNKTNYLTDCILPGEDDGVVSVSSVEKFEGNGTSSLTTPINYSHTSILDTEAYNVSMSKLTTYKSNELNTQSSNLLNIATNSQMQLLPPQVGVLGEGQGKQHTILIASNTKSNVGVLWNNGDLTLKLRSPNGQTYDSTNVEAGVYYHSNVMNTGLKQAWFEINNSQPGNWILETQGYNMPTEGTAYVTISSEENNINFNSVVEKQNVNQGSTVTFQVYSTEDNQPMINSTVRANVYLPDNSVKELSLYDNGLDGDNLANDGFYTATFNDTNLGGQYNVFYQIFGTETDGDSFSRYTTSSFSVTTKEATFSNSYSYNFVDSDANKLYDSIDINLVVNSNKIAPFILSGEIVDSSGKVVSKVTNEVHLNSGSQTVKLSFIGSDFGSEDFSGNLTVSKITLEDISPGFAILSDEKNNILTINNISSSKFERLPKFGISEIISDSAVDSNNDGYFDSLITDLNINVPKNGLYRISGSLADQSGQELIGTSTESILGVGSNTITLNFPVYYLGANAIDGPYTIKNINIQYVPDPLLNHKFSETLNTQAYQSNTFNSILLRLAQPDALQRISGNVQLSTDIVSKNPIIKVEYLMDEELVGITYNSPYSLELNGLNYSEGIHSLRVRAYDLTGSIVETSMEVFVTGKVTITSPTETNIINGITNVNATFEKIDPYKVNFYVDGVLKETKFIQFGTKSVAFSFNPYGLNSIDQHLIRIEAFSRTQTYSSVSEVNVNLDKEAPVVTITEPANGTVIKGTKPITISATSQDNYAVKNIELYVNNNLISSSVGSTITTNYNLLKGTSEIKAIAYDNIGNKGIKTISVSK